MRTRLLAVLSALALVAPAAASADDTTPTLKLQGTGVAFVTPDVATLDIGVRSGSHLRASARSKANARTRNVVAAPVAGGVARTDIQTSGVRLERVRVGRRPFYLASNAIQVRVTPIATLGTLIDAATKAGADAVDGPSFDFSDPSAGRAEAARNALADARRRADDMAAAAGQRVTGVRSIVVDPGEGPSSFASDSASGAAASPTRRKDGQPTVVAPGREQVEATVEVVYTLAPA